MLDALQISARPKIVKELIGQLSGHYKKREDIIWENGLANTRASWCAAGPWEMNDHLDYESTTLRATTRETRATGKPART